MLGPCGRIPGIKGLIIEQFVFLRLSIHQNIYTCKEYITQITNPSSAAPVSRNELPVREYCSGR